jgi:hypothetical protein
VDYCVQNIYLKNFLYARALIGHNLTVSRFFDALLSRVDRAEVMGPMASALKSETTTASAQPSGNTDLQVMDLALVSSVEHSKNGRPMRWLHLQSRGIGSSLTPKKRRELGRTS